MQFLKKGLKHTFSAIKKDKLLFMKIFFIQLIILVASFSLFTFYELKMINDVQGVIQSTANLNLENVDATTFNNPELFGQLEIMENSYQAMSKNFAKFTFYSMILFLILNGLIWLMTDSLLEHKHNFWKSAPKKWLKFAGSSVLVTAIFFLISFIVIQLFSQKVELEAFRTIGQVLMLVSLLFTYFLIVGFALINVGSWKDFFKKMYHIAITKIHYLLLLILIMGVIYALIFYLIFLIMFSFPQLFVLVTLLLIILVVFMAISRIFWVACIKDFSENK